MRELQRKSAGLGTRYLPIDRDEHRVFACLYFPSFQNVRTLKNIFVRGQSETVFEQRLIELRRNKKASRNSEKLPQTVSS